MESQDKHQDGAISDAYADQHSAFIFPNYEYISPIDEEFQKDHWARMMYENDPFGSLDMLMPDAGSQRGPSTSSTSPVERGHKIDHGDNNANDERSHGNLHPSIVGNGGDPSDRGQDAEMSEPDDALQGASPSSMLNQDCHFGGISDTDFPPQQSSSHTSSPGKDRPALTTPPSTLPVMPPNRSCTHEAPVSSSPGTQGESPGSQTAESTTPLRNEKICNPGSRKADNSSRFAEPRGLSGNGGSRQSCTKSAATEVGFDLKSAPSRTLAGLVSPLSGILSNFLGSGRPPKEETKDKDGSSLFTNPQQPELVPGRGPLQRAFQQPPAPPTTRLFRVYVGDDKQNPTSSHTVQLSVPGRLEDFDRIPEADLKAIRDAPENAAWHGEVSRLFWRRVMEHNADLLPADDARLRRAVFALLCRSNVLIEDLWTAHQVYKSMVLPVHWKANGEPSLLRLKYWMTRPGGGDNATWRTTLASKETDYERLVPWVPRERLIALCILLRKGHPGEIVRIGLNGEPVAHARVRQSKTMARKKLALVAGCHLLYQCRDATPRPEPSPYWAGFREALAAGRVRVWDETTAAAHRAADDEARWAYDAEDRGARRAGGPSRGLSVVPPPSREPSVVPPPPPPPPRASGSLEGMVAVPEQRWPALFRDARGSAMMAAAHEGDADRGRGIRDLRVQQLDREVAQLRAYVRTMYEHLAAHSKDFPAPPPWM